MSENGGSELPSVLENQQNEVPKMSENGGSELPSVLENQQNEESAVSENGITEAMSDLEKKVCQQIEYYFGDHNLPRDRFLKEQIKLDDGWVTLETMIKFNRLSSLTTDFSVIIKALQKSKTDLLEISEDKTKIRRSPNKPLPEYNEEYKEVLKKRTVYAKGFPLETTLDDVKEWLEDKGKVENVFMRKDAQRQFKGSIFAVFDTVETAKSFIETPDMKYKDNDLLVLSKTDYFNKKAEEKKKIQLESKSNSNQAKYRQKKAEDAEMKSLFEKTGCLLKFSGDLDDSTSRENLHEVFASHGEIKWIDFSRGAKNGIILFKDSAKEALEKAKEANGGTLKLKNKETVWEVVEGDEEKEALKKMMEDQQESFNKKKGRGRRSKGQGRRGGQTNKSKVTFQGKKTTFESEDESDEETAPVSPKKRALEENEAEEPASKLQKTENDSKDK